MEMNFEDIYMFLFDFLSTAEKIFVYILKLFHLKKIIVNFDSINFICFVFEGTL